MMRQGKLTTPGLIQPVVSLGEGPEVFRLIRDEPGKAIKYAVRFREADPNGEPLVGDGGSGPRQSVDRTQMLLRGGQRVKVWARTQPLARHPIDECLGVIARLGFDGVEVCLENDDLGPEILEEHLVHRVRDRVRSLGLVPFSVGYHKDYIYDDGLLNRTIEAIRWTPEFGSRVLVFSGTGKRTGDGAEWRRMVDRTRQLVEVAEECGVVLAQEFEPDFVVGSTAELLQLFDEIPSPHLAANLDLGHVFLCDPDPLQAIRDLGQKIVHVHIENMYRGVHDHLLPQDGDMDLARYIRVLAEVGYEGGLTLDLYKHDYEQVAGEAIRYIRGLIP